MFNAIAAGVAGVALAAGSVLSPVPVTELGYQPTEASGGWFKIDTARPFDVKFDADSVIFTGTGPLEMEAWRALDDKDLVFTLDKLDGVDIDGDGAYVKFPYAYVEGDIAGKKVDGPTSLVYEPEAILSEQVALTFWGNERVNVSVEAFSKAVKAKDIEGVFGGAIAAGYANTANTGEKTVSIDTVTFDGTTWDFGKDTEEPPAVPPTKDDCKNGGWKDLTDAAGNDFKNQGQCVAYFS